MLREGGQPRGSTPAPAGHTTLLRTQHKSTMSKSGAAYWRSLRRNAESLSNADRSPNNCPAVVNRTVCPPSTAWYPRLLTTMVLPTPFGPTSTTLLASFRNSSVINSSIAARSHCCGHFQSKSAIGLKRPICAERRRLSRLRRCLASASHATHCLIDARCSAEAVTSAQWLSNPYSRRS